MKRYWSEICAALFLAVVISCFGGVIVYASSAEQQITDQMELTDLQSMVDEMLGEKTFSVAEAFHRLLSGEEVLSEESVREFLHSLLFYGIEREKELIVKLLLLLLFAAVFSGFAGAFDNGQVGEISFYVVYLLVFTLLMNSFSGLSASLLSMLAWITEFMKELSPVYFMAVAAASGASSAAAFYQGVLLLVWLFQWILERVLLPGVSLYILLRFVNHLSREEMLGKMADLLGASDITWSGSRTAGGAWACSSGNGFSEAECCRKNCRCSSWDRERGKCSYGTGPYHSCSCKKQSGHCAFTGDPGGGGGAVGPIWTFVTDLSLSGGCGAACIRQTAGRSLWHHGRGMCTSDENPVYCGNFMYAYISDPDGRRRLGMRTELYQWMKSLAFFHVLTTALLHILPDKRYEQYIRLFMGLLLVLLICTPIFAVVGKSEELLSGFSNNYGREEQVRMETEAEGIRETFLKGAYEQELKDQVQGILRKEGIFSAKTEVDMEKELQLTITLYGTVTEKQREAVKNELERICGLRKGQYQILASEDGMEGVGSFPSSGNPSSGGRTSGNPKEQ